MMTWNIVWLVLMLVFLVAEGATAAMVSLWFVLGSLAALVTSLLGGEVWLQFVVFFLVSAVSLGLLRPLSKKFVNPRITSTNVNALPGTKGLVSEAIDNVRGQGQVKLGGVAWTARSSDDQPIPTGTLVQVDRIEGVKAFVSPVREQVPQS